MPRVAHSAAGFVALGLVLLIISACAIFDEGPQRSVPLDSAGEHTGRWKLLVKMDGLYVIDEALLHELGSSLESLRRKGALLSHEGEPIPYSLTENGLLFYGQSPTSRYAPARAYLLELDAAGPQMREVSVMPAEGEASARSLTQFTRLEHNRVYDGRARRSTVTTLVEEPWYWETIQHGGSFSTDFDLPRPVPERGTIRIRMRGVTDLDRVTPDHDVDVTLNGHSLGRATWDGDSHFLFTADLTSSAMRSGQNRLIVDNGAPGNAAVDVMQIDWLEIAYESSTVADGLSLFESSGGTVELTGLDETATILDISDPQQPALLTGYSHDGRQARLQTTAKMRLLVSAAGALLQPEVVPWRESNWSDSSHEADLLIITPEALLPEIEPLVARREQQGLRVRVVPTEDIYDAFGEGQISPEAIRNFVSYASNNWQAPAPAYLLLVGDATYDFRGYQSSLPQYYVPSLMVRTTFGGETLSDSRLADLDGDRRADLAVGRLPVNDRHELADYVTRLLEAEDGLPSSRLLFAADGSETQFALVTRDLLAAVGLQGNQRVTRLTGATASELLQQWNQGAWLVNYVGHGSIERWGKSDLFSNSTVEGLNQLEVPPMVIQMTCLTGYFGHPDLPSLTEEMLFHPHGPVIVFGATSLTLSSNQTPFGTALVRALLDPSILRVGDALQQAKGALNIAMNDELRVVSDTFALFGDPSAPVLRPQ